MAGKAVKQTAFRQVELRRKVEKGWEGMAGYTTATLMFPDKEVPAVGADFYALALSAPEVPWTVHWRDSQVTMRAV